ncbi:MAG TPA: diaminopimelate epimerase, partial [Acidobacteriota bacterium]|nr:diaminopimelate epimerase [Acidobacteriota bacterium]
MNCETKQRIHFFKMTGTGNDFILIDNRKRIIDANQCRDFVRRACRHKVSVGADGMILIENDSEADFGWRFFNADGSEAEMCGNGARCAARFAYLTGIVDRPRMTFRTLAGNITAELLDTKVKVRMPLPHSLCLDVSLEAEGRRFELDTINSGVPHAVCFFEDERGLEEMDVARWGKALRYHPHFHPAGTNVNFVYVDDPHRLTVRTYERGVEGETLACGTGCIASALTAAAVDLVQSPVDVKVRSGELLTIYFHKDAGGRQCDGILFDDVFLEGEAMVVYE